MSNVTINDLPQAVLPLDPDTTIFEVQALEGGEVLSRKISATDIANLSGNSLGTLSDVTLTLPTTGSILYKSAGDWLNTDAITIDPAGAVTLAHNGTPQFSTESDGVSIPFFSKLYFDGGGVGGDTFFREDVPNRLTLFVEGSQIFEIVDRQIRMFVDADEVIKLTAGTMDLQALGGNSAFRFGRDGTVNGIITSTNSSAILRAEKNSSLVILQARDTLGIAQSVLQGSGDGALSTYFDGASVTATISAANGGMQVNNQFTGAGLERVLTTSDLGGGGASELNDLTDVTLTSLATGQSFYKSAGNWLNTSAILIDPAAAVTFAHNATAMARTATIGNGGMEVNNTVTGAGFERVLTTSDIGGGGGSLDGLSDVTITTVATGQLLYKSAGNWLNTSALIIDPALSVQIAHNATIMARTATIGNGGMEVNNTVTGAGFERVLTTGDLGGGGSLAGLSDVTLSAPTTGSVLYKSAGNWLNSVASDFAIIAGTGVKIGSSGTAASNGDDILIARGGDSNGGITIITAASSTANINFGTTTTDIVGGIQFNQLEKALKLKAGAGVVRLTIGESTIATGVGINVFDINHSDSAGGVDLLIRNSEGGAKFGVNAGNIILSQTNSSGGVLESWIECNLNGSVDLYHNGTIKFKTLSNGVALTATGQRLYFDNGANTYLSEVTGDVISFIVGGNQTFDVSNGNLKLTGTGNPSFDFFKAGVQQGYFNATQDRVTLASTVNSGFVRLIAENSGGTEVTALEAYATETIINFSGSPKFKTTTGGIDVTGNVVASGALTVGGTPTITKVTSTPEGSLSAPVGSLALNSSGGVGTSFYVKQTGTGNTGWLAVA